MLDLRSGHQRSPVEAPADGFEDRYNYNNNNGQFEKEETQPLRSGGRDIREQHPNKSIRRWLTMGYRETLGELMT